MIVSLERLRMCYSRSHSNLKVIIVIIIRTLFAINYTELKMCSFAIGLASEIRILVIIYVFPALNYSELCRNININPQDTPITTGH